MAFLSREEKQKVFKEELEHLINNGYITFDEYTRLLDARREYMEDVESENRTVETFTTHTQDQREDLSAAPEPVKKVNVTKPVKKKKQKTAEQIRERNITWTLILGVSILLVTGLIVATSQWEQMGAATKVISISGVSLFFFALSYGTGRFLKIRQTAFAFLTLGSLLIPIIVVAIGYFEIFGSYLSLFGEGRYVLGLIGALLPLPLYVRHAFVHKSRLYVWISLLFLTLTAGFALGALPFSVDAFYFGLMLYNAGLLLGYIRLKKHTYVQLFLKELPLFAQLNLVVSTLLMLFFFQSEVFYSFNLLLTASIYMAMVFVYKTKEYQFVFSVMIVYAAYQLVEHTPIQSLDSLVYALVGLLYIGFAYAFRNHSFIEKVFRYTSGVVSFLAFIYISYEGILVQNEASSWLLLSAYGLITVNYLILSHLTRYNVFAYLTPIFFFVAAAQLWDLLRVGPWFFFLFVAASMTLLYVGVWSKVLWVQTVKESSFYVSLFVLTGSLYYGLADLQYGYSAIMLVLLGIAAYFVSTSTRDSVINNAAIWVQPLAWLLGSAVFYQKLIDWAPGYEDGYAMPFHLALTAIILLGLHYGWKKFGQDGIANSSFYVAQGSYVLAMLLLMANLSVDPVVVRPLMLLAGIGMMFLLVRYVGHSYLWGFVSIVGLAFYLSLLDPLPIESFQGIITYVIFAPVLLVFLAEVGEKKWQGLRPYFYWLAQVVQPLVIGLVMLNQLGVENIYPLILLLPLGVYVYSSLVAKKEWEIKAMLYAALSTGFFLIYAVPGEHGLWEIVQEEYAFLLASVLMAGLWILVSEKWKQRMEWYWIPFSIFGLFTIIVETPMTGNFEWLWNLGYVALILFFLHRKKWSLVRFAPLLLTIKLWEDMSIVWNRPQVISALVICVGALLTAGCYFHRRLIGPEIKVDAYSWTAIVYIAYLSLYTIVDENVWVRIIPVLLVGLWLFIEAERWKETIVTKSFYTVGVASIYGAYLMVLKEYAEIIPELIFAELQVLPLLGVLVLLKRKTWWDYRSIINHVQFAILLFIAGYLVVDAIQNHTIWDAWMIGGLSLVSMVTGMQLRIKSYFLVGMGVLIFNVIYQTSPYWGRMPWWVYLLIAGLVLIGIASYNEWKKQRSDSEQPVEQKWKKVWTSFKKWN